MSSCDTKYIKTTTGDYCVKDCPGSHPYTQYDKECVASCYNEYKLQETKCLPNCTAPYALMSDSKTCSNACTYRRQSDGLLVCVDSCTQGEFHNITNGRTECVAACDDSEYKLVDGKKVCQQCGTHYIQETSARQCVDNCADTDVLVKTNLTYTKYTPGTKEMTKCHTGNCESAGAGVPYMGDERICVSSCTHFYKIVNGAKECVNNCTDGQAYKNMGLQRECVSNCPLASATTSYNGIPECVGTCPTDKKYKDGKNCSTTCMS